MQKMENKLEDKNRFKIIWNVQEKKNPQNLYKWIASYQSSPGYWQKCFPVNCQDFMSGTSKDSVQDANSDKHQ